MKNLSKYSAFDSIVALSQFHDVIKERESTVMELSEKSVKKVNWREKRILLSFIPFSSLDSSFSGC